VMALYMTIVLGGTPIGAPIIGWIGQHLGARWSLVIGGVLTILGVALALAVYARLRGGARSVLHASAPAGSLFSRVWVNQAVVRARTQPEGQASDSDTQIPVSETMSRSR
jgi:MFS family permease